MPPTIITWYPSSSINRSHKAANLSSLQKFCLPSRFWRNQNNPIEPSWPDSDSFQKDAGVEFTYIMTSKRARHPKNTKYMAAPNAPPSTGKSPITPSISSSAKPKPTRLFFAYLPYTQTHEPVDAHPDFKGKTGNGSFADVLAQTDAYVGEILDTIDELGLKDNTIFIFTSDNGREGIKRSFGFTGPWRGGMFSPYEGSLRVPFLISWPGKIPARQVSNDIVSHNRFVSHIGELCRRRYSARSHTGWC